VASKTRRALEVHNQAVRRRLRAATKARWADPEQRKKLTAACAEAQARPETKAKIAAKARARWARPAYKQKLKLAIKAAMSRPEVKERLSAGQIAGWRTRRKRLPGGAAQLQQDDLLG
jgi:hypothetical protein